jgi:formylglycine-generating enzyme required for sulfatase activity
LEIFDMSGNVYEWCQDRYDSGAYERHSQHNPLPEIGGSSRVIRGGGWISNPQRLRCTSRVERSAGTKNGYLGFRLARD